MPDLIRVGEANVKHNVQIPSQIPLRQHFVALQLMVYIIQLQTHVWALQGPGIHVQAPWTEENFHWLTIYPLSHHPGLTAFLETLHFPFHKWHKWLGNKMVFISSICHVFTSETVCPVRFRCRSQTKFSPIQRDGWICSGGSPDSAPCNGKQVTDHSANEGQKRGHTWIWHFLHSNPAH